MRCWVFDRVHSPCSVYHGLVDRRHHIPHCQLIYPLSANRRLNFRIATEALQGGECAIQVLNPLYLASYVHFLVGSS